MATDETRNDSSTSPQGAKTSDTPSKGAPVRRPRETDAAAEARQTALHVAAAALDKKALNVEIIDVRGKVDYADYVVLMSGRSDRQVSAIAGGIRESLKRDYGTRCLGVEGLPQGNWVLMDFGDVVVHIFHRDTRGYYDLEALWIDAARVGFDGETGTHDIDATEF